MFLYPRDRLGEGEKGVRDEGVSVGAPTLRADNHHFGGKAVIYLSFFFGDEIFLYPPRVKLSGSFGRSGFLGCRGPGGMET